jgi:tetratricopeptide (TPR) repeat protein
MKKTLGILFVVVLIGSMIRHQASAARGGGNHGGGGARAPSGGGGAHVSGGGRPSFGHAPTFSVPRSLPHPAIHESPPHEIVGRTPAFRPEVQPNIERPNIERPNIVARPEIGQRPIVENRPNLGNHNEFVEHGGLGARPTIENRYHGGDFAHGETVARARGAGYGAWYHGDWHDHWDHAWYQRPITWWGTGWWGAGYYPGYAAWNAPWSWGYWSYNNPYYTAPAVVGDSIVDYSQPLVLAGGGAEAPQTAQDQAMQIFNTARDTFQRGDYPLALTQINQALGLMPSDVVLNEFRGLVLFALRQYPDAGATVYAVLAAGPGWDWTTLSNLYPDTDVYTEQLRALEQYVRTHPQEADVRFLLAYHYLTCGYTDQAATQLAAAVRLNPTDQLSAQLLASLTAPNSTAPSATGAVASNSVLPALPTPTVSPTAAPVTAAALTGTWSAARPDGGKISLSLGGDSKYDWRYTANGKTQDFSGNYQLADNVLILKQGSSPTMVGEVTPLGNSEFNFKLAGNNASDPGLTFTR